MELFSYGSLAEREADASNLAACWQQTGVVLRAREDALIYCPICAETSQRPLESYNAREEMACGHCGLIARIRSAIGLLERHAKGSRVYMTEQTTPAYVRMARRFPEIIGSEYAPCERQRQRLAEHLARIGGSGPIRFEDVTALTMPDDSLDAILTLDVLEHVPDYPRALREFARVLSPGGALVATFPFTDSAHTNALATVRDGLVTHRCAPEYHGDPLGEGGVLCFYHFGWDVLDAARAAGFSSARMVLPWAPQQGIYFGCWALVAVA